MKTCPITTLRIHSAGRKYAPVKVGFEWQLQNADGNVLCGYRGKPYSFEFEKNASTWLCTNLSRVKNATQNVSDERLSLISKIYLDTGDAFALQEVHDIWDLNADLWQPVECAGATEYITVEASIDYDGGNANGIVV
jgi:hypothetical protein